MSRARDQLNEAGGYVGSRGGAADSGKGPLVR